VSVPIQKSRGERMRGSWRSRASGRWSIYLRMTRNRRTASPIVHCWRAEL